MAGKRRMKGIRNSRKRWRLVGTYRSPGRSNPATPEMGKPKRRTPVNTAALAALLKGRA